MEEPQNKKIKVNEDSLTNLISVEILPILQMGGRASKNVILPAQLDDLPDEVNLKIFVFLRLKELHLCVLVSKRLRWIANDESLWIVLNLFEKKVPYDFIEKAARNGC